MIPLSLGNILLISGVVRLLLVMWGEVQDRWLDVKYTDIDYIVFTDAARFITEGGSPYDRNTYRYSPLLALVLVPNVTLHGAWGKVLFSCCDLLVAGLIASILTREGYSRSGVLSAVISWLFNPFTFTISTRGSCDVLAALLLLSTLYLLTSSRSRVAMPLAALVFGLAVHLRVYPIIYTPSLIFFLNHQSLSSRKASRAEWIRTSLYHCLSFGVISALTFVFLGLFFYNRYGWVFLQEAFLHHLTRKDHRHSFSSHFYPIYLGLYGQGDARFVPDISLGSSLVQISLQAYLSVHLHRDLPLCLLVQTMSFVALNKVCTAQYFVWWFCLLPLCVPRLKWPLRRPAIAAISLWIMTQLHWLFWGYQLEFMSKAVHLFIWAAGLVFMAANVLLIIEVISLKEPTPAASSYREVKLKNKVHID
jgi:phosphatidylinositol glycan class M